MPPHGAHYLWFAFVCLSIRSRRPCPNAGLSKHGDPGFPHFCPLNQNLARVLAQRGG